MTRKTSIAAYQKIEEEGLLSKARWSVYAWLFYNGPATAGEIGAGIDYVRNNTSARLVELKKMGVVEEVGEKVCPTSGHNVILFDVTDQLPRGFTTSPTRKTRKQLEAEWQWLFDECVRLKKILDEHDIEYED